MTVDHIVLWGGRAEYDGLRGRLVASGKTVSEGIKDSSGARGKADEAFYFLDPDGNVLEARWYA